MIDDLFIIFDFDRSNNCICSDKTNVINNYGAVLWFFQQAEC